MLKVDNSLNHIPARREHVIALFESINQPLVNIPNFGTAPTGAFILGTRNDHGYFTVFVYLYQPETKAVMIYVSEPRNLTAEQYRVEEAEAIRFVESMGFMVDNVHFPTLGVPEQEAVMGRVPLFRPLERTVDLYEAVDGQQQQQQPMQAQQPMQPQQPMQAQHTPLNQDAAALFGGMNPQAGEVFQRAGIDGFQQQPNPQVNPSQVAYSSPPGQQVPMQPQHTPMQPQHTPMQPQHTPMQPQHTPMQQQPTPSPTGLAAGLTMPDPSQTGAPPVPGSNPAAPQQPDRSQLSPEALERLGRLIGAFCILFSIFLFQGCQTPNQTRGASALIDLGNQHLAEFNYTEAIKHFTQVLEEEESNKFALRGIGLCYLKLNRLNEAEQYFRQAIKSDPKWSEPKNELATVLIERKSCEEPVQLLNTVLEDIFYQTPQFAEHNLARALMCQGKGKEAVDRLEKLMIKRPHFCLGYLTLAQFSLQEQKFDTTIKSCDGFDTNCAQHKEIKKQVLPVHTNLCYLLKGRAYSGMGDLESAKSSFLRCCPNGNSGSKECCDSLQILR